MPRRVVCTILRVLGRLLSPARATPTRSDQRPARGDLLSNTFRAHAQDLPRWPPCHLPAPPSASPARLPSVRKPHRIWIWTVLRPGPCLFLFFNPQPLILSFSENPPADSVNQPGPPASSAPFGPACQPLRLVSAWVRKAFPFSLFSRISENVLYLV
jgi:hypothetical protein